MPYLKRAERDLLEGCLTPHRVVCRNRGRFVAPKRGTNIVGNMHIVRCPEARVRLLNYSSAPAPTCRAGPVWQIPHSAAAHPFPFPTLVLPHSDKMLHWFPRRQIPKQKREALARVCKMPSRGRLVLLPTFGHLRVIQIVEAAEASRQYVI